MRTKLLRITLLFLWISQLTVQAQNPAFVWEKPSYIGYGYGIDYLNDHIYCTGYEETGPGIYFFVSKFDTAGNEVWKSTMSSVYSGAIGTDVIANSNGSVAVSGTIANLTGFFTDFIAVFDTLGDSVWFEEYNFLPNPNGFQEFKSMIAPSQGGYLIGSNQLIRTDAAGNLLWNLPYAANDVIQTSDGGFAACGTVSVGPDYEIFVLRLDANGDSLWYKEYNVGSEARGMAIMEDPISQTFYVLGENENPSISFDKNVMLIQLSDTGAVNWSKTYVRNGADNAFSMQRGPSNEIILGVSMLDSISGELITMQAVNNAGDPIWYAIHGMHQISSYFEFALDGISAWEVGVLEGIVPQFSIMKFDLGATVGIPGNGPAFSMTLWPNPAKDQIRVDFGIHTATDWSIYDLEGRKLIEGVRLGTENAVISTENLASGMYFLKANDENGVLGTLKFIVDK